MTRGERIVVGVRAQSLADAIRLLQLGRLEPAAVRWQAERLRSSCERALGTRRRHYDRHG